MNHNKIGFIDPFILWTGIITVLILVGAVFLGIKSGGKPSVDESNQVKISLSGTSADWGTIDYDKGIVSKSFEIKNDGTETLQLFDVKTSCMCTTAQLITPSKTSQKFQMHDESSSVFTVGPGETAQLLVEFDPAFHGPSGVGPITRTITLETNDVSQKELSFELTGTVVKK